MSDSHYTNWEKVWDDLGGRPSEAEIGQLRVNYPTYEFPHRLPLLEGLLWGGTDKETTDAKLKAKGIDPASVDGRSFTRQQRWTRAKMRRAVFRVLYLRHRCTEGLERKAANQRIFAKFFVSGRKDSFQRSISRATRSPVLDAT